MTQPIVRAVLLAVVLPVLAMVLIAATCELAVGSSTGSPRTCFSRSAWSARDGLRPCVRVRTVYEDGSFEYSVTDANGTVRYTARAGSEE